MTNGSRHHPEFVTGRARYAADTIPADALAVAVVRSPVPYGRVRAVDTRDALKVPGVVAALTARDLGDVVPVIPIRSFATPALDRLRQPVLASRFVRYRGEPLAVVVAEDRATAEAASRSVRVDIDTLPPVVDVSEAPELMRVAARDGNIADAFARAAVVLDREVGSDRHTGLPLETRGLVAQWNGAELHLWGPTKFVDHTTVTVAAWMGLDPEAVHVHPVAVGGMFGVRGELYPEDFLVPWVAGRVGRTVAWTEDRVEHLVATNHAPGLVARLSVAVDGDGALTALRAHVRLDMGAYPRGNGARLATLAIEELVGPYAWQALEIEAVGVRTNATPAGSVRAPVAAEATFFRESTVDAVARRAGISGEDVRRRSLITPAVMPFRRRYGPAMHGQLYDGGDYPALLDLLQPTIRDYEARARSRRDEGKIAGTGLAMFLAHSGVSAREAVTLELRDGALTVSTSLTEVGQGLDKVLRDVASDALGIPAELVAVASGARVPHGAGRGTFSSRSTLVAVHACREAAGRLLDAVFARIAADDGCQSAEVTRSGAGFQSPLRDIAWSELRGPVTATGSFDDPEPLLGIGAHAALIVIDRGTGRVEVERLTVAYDCGKAIDPEGVRGQLLGGAVHGVGIALTESLGDAAGSATSRSLLEYRLPTAADVPHVDVHIVEGGTSRNALGAKGAGEAGVIGAPAAIAIAVTDALLHAQASTVINHAMPASLPIRERWLRAQLGPIGVLP